MAAPSQDGTVAASMRRDNETLVFTGVLARDAVARLWQQALPQLAGVRRLDLTAVESVDSAGLALLAELSDRVSGATLEGMPAGLRDLHSAYRLDDTLAFSR